MDLPALQARGVGLAGRLTDADGRRLRLAGDLAATTGEAGQRLRRLLRKIDAFAERTAIAPQAGHAEPIRQAQVTGGPAELDLLHAGIGTIIWATGYRRSYPWLHVPVLDDHGDIRHLNGTTASPGLHVAGMRWQTRRSSSFLDGVRHDAAMVVSKVLNDLRGPLAAAGAPNGTLVAGGGSLDRDPAPIVTGTRPSPDQLHAPSSKAPQCSRYSPAGAGGGHSGGVRVPVAGRHSAPGALNFYRDRPGRPSGDQHADALVVADVAASWVLEARPERRWARWLRSWRPAPTSISWCTTRRA